VGNAEGNARGRSGCPGVNETYTRTRDAAFEGSLAGSKRSRGAIRTVTTLVASTVAVVVSAWALRDKEFLGVPGWLAAIAVGVFLVATVSAFLLGRKSYRRLAPTAAERAREELEIAPTTSGT
jgi:multisubunit Na+/H+ antiporter MnhG subunit